MKMRLEKPAMRAKLRNVCFPLHLPQYNQWIFEFVFHSFPSLFTRLICIMIKVLSILDVFTIILKKNVTFICISLLCMKEGN